MRWAFLAIGSLLASPALANPGAPQAPAALQNPDEAAPAPLSESELFELETERYRRLTVPVTIGDHGPFRFMIDTGAQVTVLSRELADQLALTQRTPAMLVAMASTRVVETTRVPEITLGRRAFSVPGAAILEGANIGDADGILGLDSLQHQRVLIDFERGLLQVADADDLGGNRGFDIMVRARYELGQLIIHRARIDGVRVAVIIDTGAQGSIGNLALERRLSRSPTHGEQVLTDVNGVQLQSELRLARNLEMGRASIDKVALAFTDSPTFAKLGLIDEPAMVLGMSELRLFKRVAIDFATREVLFALPRSTNLAQTEIFGRTSRIR